MDKDRELERKGKGIMRFALIIILLLLGVALWISKEENDQLKVLIKQKNSMIENLAWSDSLLNVFMDVKYDSIKTDTSNIVTRRLMTFSINGKKLTYPELHALTDSLVSEQSSLKDSLWAYKTIVKLLKKNYPIYTSIASDGKKMYVEISSSALDSALILYPIFKDRIIYLENSKTWKLK